MKLTGEYVNINGRSHDLVKSGLHYTRINSDAASAIIEEVKKYKDVDIFRCIRLAYLKCNPNNKGEVLVNGLFSQNCKEWLESDRFDLYAPVYYTSVMRKNREDLGDSTIKAHKVDRAFTFSIMRGVSAEHWIKIIQRMSK